MAKTTTVEAATAPKLTKNNIDTSNFFRFVMESDLRLEAAVLLRAAIGKKDIFGTEAPRKKAKRTRKKRGPKAKTIIH